MLQTVTPTLQPVPSARAPMVTIRCAKPRDLAELREMVAELAAHHGDAATITPEQLERDLFGRTPWITALVAEAGGALIGYAILVPQYRAAEGARGMEMHHLFVRPGHRGTASGATSWPRLASRRKWRAATTSRSVPPPETSRRTVSTSPSASCRAR